MKFFSSIYIRLVYCLLGALLLLSGCDSSFEPHQENSRYYFSMFGYLDASADTQWVRIMPVRDSLLHQPHEIDATVTLEELETGKTITLNDSLFHFSNNRYAHNFWTTQPLEPSRTYRLKAERSDGAASHTTITLPTDYPTPIAYIWEPDDFTPDRIDIKDIEKLVDAQVIHQTQDQRSTINFIKDTVVVPDRSYQVLIQPWINYESIGTTLDAIPNEDLKIFVAAATNEFPDFATIDEITITFPGGVSNVENGVGYVAGIVSKTIPYRSCFNNNLKRTPCPLIK
ncbi:hypothetical protein LQ318_12130 [Aliifodinibius salicampi]|uniref:DUF4249 family protein n=1 Tax=Fodinibius salicampi TaxID=1920655 RepID=A0ABT3Q0M2_9BACT|nr:hypothetical protein [Fodinibius salicampi]MCW9713650.1 hypothetical protein [Fodinibius salicampi]